MSSPAPGFGGGYATGVTDPAPHLIGCDLTELTTERLRLRPLGPDDLDPVHDYLSRPDVCRYLLHEPRTRQQVAEALARSAGRTSLRTDGDSVRLAVVRREDE